MYSEGYVATPDKVKNTLINIVDMCIDLDMYVIIDWHILADNNPNIYSNQASLFFDEISTKYANTPNVIYEICNEPNGNDVTWDKDIKPYAEKIIPIIRKNSPKSLIIVGTPFWCQKLEVAADNPLNFNNIVYACHFYSGSHGNELKNSIDYALSKNIPIFVSECGMTDASGNGILYFNEFDSWIKFLDNRNISWIVWSFANKDESSAILKPNYNTSANPKLNIDDYLTEAGKHLKNIFNQRKIKAN